MKTVYWGIILLAFLLAAMVTVPMVSAAEERYGTTQQDFSLCNGSVIILNPANSEYLRK
ncbi:hypothetical protein [Methanoregula sp.]|jgi:hypothetical protein|uniref:hypothetical protein n=1 Tax=Methanoregula sp. TaxID=2052170 RepID=UPI003564CB0C